MAQFDVFVNPVIRGRAAYPFVIVLQADAAESGRDRAVAPLAPRSAFPDIRGKLTPIVNVDGDELVLLVTSLTTIPAASLDSSVASLTERRADILAAVDYLFFGV